MRVKQPHFMKRTLFRHLLILLIWPFSFTTNVCAQEIEGVGIGQWRLHLPYNTGISVAEGSGKVFCATSYGLFNYTKADGSIERLSRINGLSDYNVTVMRYHESLKILVLGYDNSNIDLILNDNTVINISDIKRKNIVGNKSINAITLIDNIAYLSCGFGIVQLDLKKYEIKDTWYIGPNGSALNVNGLAFDGSAFYAATNSGIYKAMANDPNIFNYTAWSQDNSLPNIYGKYGTITFFDGKVYTVNNDSIPNYDNVLVYDGSAWSYFYDLHYYNTRIDSYNDHLIIGNYFSVEVFGKDLLRTHIVGQSSYANGQPYTAIVDDQNVLWVADRNNGLVKNITEKFSFEIILPNGPGSVAVFDMDGKGDDIWVASGNRTGAAASYLTAGSYLFSNNFWSTYNMNTDPKYAALTDSRDVVCVAVDPSDSKHAFIGTWGSGLLEYRSGGIVNVYDSTNSTLRPLNITGFRPVQVGGVAFDSKNDLWSVTELNSTPLCLRKTNGSWYSFALPAPLNNSYSYDLMVDGFDQKWLMARGTGLGVFHENDLSNPNDNSFKLLTNAIGNGNLPSINVFSIAEDKDNTIWIGSDKGVAVIYSPYNIFGGGDFDAQRIIVEEGGYAQYLLENETVMSIAIDGANRKWFGTLSGGAFLQSADGTKKLLNFNTENSPLLSNAVYSIAINDNTGEVFFGTDKGIISYRGTATEGEDYCNEAYAYPNPVKHDYQGLIAIKGLVANADVKITDISGTLIYQTKAEGGQAVWNGNNFDGRRAHTGVYLIFAANEDGTQTCVTKLLFVN